MARMAFWILVAVLSAAVTFAVARPLLRAQSVTSNGADGDLAVYKDQFKEIDADYARGLISSGEAEAAKTEVARRLLRVAEAQPVSRAAIAPAAPGLGQRLFYIVSAAIPLASLGLYLLLGAPGMTDHPYGQRLSTPVDTADANDLVAKVEERLREHPEDGKGWDVIAPVYMSSGRFDEAAEAYANANKILGETVPRLEGFAMARIRASKGLVRDEARSALQRATVLDPRRQEPRIWLGLAKEQDGNIAGAVADYRALIAAAPEGANWKKALEERAAALEGKTAGGAPGGPATGTPSHPDAAAVAGMAPEEREKMIAAMVEGLANRLKADGKDLTGWLKLIRAYKVMGRDGDARTALAGAKSQFPGDAKALADLDQLAKDAGLTP